jgi:putative transposase
VRPAAQRSVQLHARGQARGLDYLETFYIPRRRHSAIGQISPAAFEKRYEDACGMTMPAAPWCPRKRVNVNGSCEQQAALASIHR